MMIEVHTDMDGKMDSEKNFGKLINQITDLSEDFEFYGYTKQTISSLNVKAPVILIQEKLKGHTDLLRRELFYEGSLQSSGCLMYFIDRNENPIAMLFLQDWDESIYPSEITMDEDRYSYREKRERQWSSMLRDKVPNSWDVDEGHGDVGGADGQYRFIAIHPDIF